MADAMSQATPVEPRDVDRIIDRLAVELGIAGAESAEARWADARWQSAVLRETLAVISRRRPENSNALDALLAEAARFNANDARLEDATDVLGRAHDLVRRLSAALIQTHAVTHRDASGARIEEAPAPPQTIDAMPGEPACVCDNCGWMGETDELRPIRSADLAAHAGAPIPDGGCPQCGTWLDRRSR